MTPVCENGNEHRLTTDAIFSRIPAFPPIVLRALSLLSGDDAISELVRVITSDATLSAQVLRLANSALFTFTTPIDTVQHAVTALGLGRIQALIITVATTNYMRAASGAAALAGCWRHTLASAIVSRDLARAAGLDPERAYTLGLLHDIGRLGLLVANPGTYDSLVAGARRDAVSLLDLEKLRFGMDHCAAGRALMLQWGLPPEVSVATGRHHDPPQGGPFDLLQVVHFACRMADSLECFVVEPLQPASFGELMAMLPPGVREPFEARAGALRQAVENATAEGPAAERPAQPCLAAAERRRASRETPAETRWPGMRNRLGASWDLLVVMVTVAVFAAVLVGLAYWAGS